MSQSNDHRLQQHYLSQAHSNYLSNTQFYLISMRSLIYIYMYIYCQQLRGTIFHLQFSNAETKIATQIYQNISCQRNCSNNDKFDKVFSYLHSNCTIIKKKKTEHCVTSIQLIFNFIQHILINLCIMFFFCRQRREHSSFKIIEWKNREERKTIIDSW